MKFWIHKNMGWEQVEGTPVKIPGYQDFDFFVHEQTCTRRQYCMNGINAYAISERICGCRATCGATPEDAIENLRAWELWDLMKAQVLQITIGGSKDRMCCGIYLNEQDVKVGRPTIVKEGKDEADAISAVFEIWKEG